MVQSCSEALESDWLIVAGGYPGFCSMKRLGVFLLPLDGMLVHRRSLPRNLLGFPNNLPVPIYTPGWREALCELSVLPKNTTQCPRPGLEPGPLDPGTSALTMRPPRLHTIMYIVICFKLAKNLCFDVIDSPIRITHYPESCERSLDSSRNLSNRISHERTSAPFDNFVLEFALRIE